MRILILSQWFQPEPTFKGLPFCQALRGEGHEVEVLTGFPNYPGGKVYPGYRIRLFQREILCGVRVNRVWLYPSHDKSGIKRFFNYASFALSGGVKDAGLILDAARDAGVDLALVPGVHDRMRAADQAGYGDLDLSATYLLGLGGPDRPQA